MLLVGNRKSRVKFMYSHIIVHTSTQQLKDKGMWDDTLVVVQESAHSMRDLFGTLQWKHPTPRLGAQVENPSSVLCFYYFNPSTPPQSRLGAWAKPSLIECADSCMFD